MAIAIAPHGAWAQEWNDVRTTLLVERAVARRRTSDTLLTDYTARAHGFLSFLAQLGDTLVEPPRLVKSSELMVEVYWKAPSLSKQVVVGMRDTALVPGDIGYYSDRYGIVQSNFPDRIRLGDGQDVRDVPHPISAASALYDFRVRDSLTLTLPARRVDVYEVDVRPKDAALPRVVGTLYLERQTGDIVQLSLTFTRAAILDARIEVLAVTIENALIDEKFWLPRRQELEVRRAGTWFDFPARGIIRARWQVSGHEVNRGVAATVFDGPPIAFVEPNRLRAFAFDGRILEHLPDDVLPVAPEDVQRVQTAATELVTRAAIAKAETGAISAASVSDLVRVNRVEGLALGIGGRWRPSTGAAVSARVRYGMADAEAKGKLHVEFVPRRGVQLGLFVQRDVRDVGDEAEVSLLRNSIGAQEFAADLTDPFDVRMAGVSLGLGAPGRAQWRLEVAAERHDPLAVHASPSTGRYQSTVAVAPMSGVRLSLRAENAATPSLLEGTLHVTGELRGGRYDVAGAGATAWTLRGFATADYRRPMDGWTLVSHSTVAVSAGNGATLPQQLVYLGGPVTGPGYEYHAFAGRAGFTQRLEARFAVPFVGIPLARFGRVPAEAKLAPFVHAVGIARPPLAGMPDGVYPAVGVGLLMIHELLRIDVARGLRDGRWTFGIDFAKAFWSVL